MGIPVERGGMFTKTNLKNMSNNQRILICMLVLIVCSTGISASESSALPAIFKPEQLLWEISLGLHQYTVPQIDRGYMFLGINDRNIKHPVVKKTDGGILMCVEQATGQMIWQLPIPRFMDGVKAPYHFNKWRCGVCSRPAIEGDRLYITGPRGDVLCVDRFGQTNGNDGPFQNETEYMSVPEDSNYQLTDTDGDIIWQFNMLTEVKVFPHDVCGTSPLLLGDFLYVSTGNGQDDLHRYIANPKAPSLIVLNKHTGQLVATEGQLFGDRLFHGGWSSPIAATFGGKTLVLYGGGDGIMYAFEPITRVSKGQQLQTLKIVWQYDCNPPEYRMRDGQPVPYSRHNKKSTEGPSEIIADPALYKNRVYVTIGQSPIHGPGQGILVCLDIATGHKIWESRKVDRSLGTPAIHDGLLYLPDYSGRLHCFDADTGRHYWQYDLNAPAWESSAAVIEDKVYVSTDKNELWVFKTGRQPQVVSKCRLDSVAITLTCQDGVLYLPTQKRLFAIKLHP
jgi:outer membrane protein assembly factor BamB